MYPDQALVDVLDTILKLSAMSVKYRLYKNDVTPTEATVLADLTEADFPGYAAIGPITEPDAAIVTHQGVSLGDEQTWTCTSTPMFSQTIYGIYVTYTNAASVEKLLRVDRFSAPISIAASGNEVKKKVNFYTKNYTP